MAGIVINILALSLSNLLFVFEGQVSTDCLCYGLIIPFENIYGYMKEKGRFNSGRGYFVLQW